MPAKKIRLTISLPLEIYETVKNMADKEKRNIGQQVLHLVEQSILKNTEE